MANQTVYIAGKDEHAVRLTAVDWALLDLPRLRPLARVAFAMLRPGQETAVPRAQLLSTAQQLLFEIELDLDRLSSAYWFEYTGSGTSHCARTGLTASIDGRARFLRAGFGLCEEAERTCGPDGRWTEQPLRDLREVEMIDTDDRGRLVIRRRPQQIVLVDVLEGLIRFVESREDAPHITLRGAGAPPSLATLIRTWEAGGESAAWAQEALWDLGAGQRDRLIALLQSPAEAALRPAVARVLMMLAGDDASREAVRSLATAERDPLNKELYLGLLDGSYVEGEQAEMSIDDQIDPSVISVSLDGDQRMDGESIDDAMRDRPRTPRRLSDEPTAATEAEADALSLARPAPRPQPDVQPQQRKRADPSEPPQPNFRPMPGPKLKPEQGA